MSTNNNYDNMPKGGRLVFGIFMVIVYVAVGLLFIFDVFNIDNTAISSTSLIYTSPSPRDN